MKQTPWQSPRSYRKKHFLSFQYLSIVQDFIHGVSVFFIPTLHTEIRGCLALLQIQNHHESQSVPC